jgi:hypothetical protein
MPVASTANTPKLPFDRAALGWACLHLSTRGRAFYGWGIWRLAPRRLANRASGGNSPKD